MAKRKKASPGKGRGKKTTSQKTKSKPKPKSGALSKKNELPQQTIGFMDLCPEIRIMIYNILYSPRKLALNGIGTVADHGVAGTPPYYPVFRAPFPGLNQAWSKVFRVFGSGSLQAAQIEPYALIPRTGPMTFRYNTLPHKARQSEGQVQHLRSRFNALIFASKIVYSEAMHVLNKNLEFACYEPEDLTATFSLLRSCGTLHLLTTLRLSIRPTDERNGMSFDFDFDSDYGDGDDEDEDEDEDGMCKFSFLSFRKWEQLFSFVEPNFLRKTCPALKKLTVCFDCFADLTNMCCSGCSVDASLNEFAHLYLIPAIAGCRLAPENVQLLGICEPEDEEACTLSPWTCIMHAVTNRPPLEMSMDDAYDICASDSEILESSKTGSNRRIYDCDTSETDSIGSMTELKLQSLSPLRQTTLEYFVTANSSATTE